MKKLLHIEDLDSAINILKAACVIIALVSVIVSVINFI